MVRSGQLGEKGLGSLSGVKTSYNKYRRKEEGNVSFFLCHRKKSVYFSTTLRFFCKYKLNKKYMLFTYMNDFLYFSLFFQVSVRAY